MTAGNLIAPLLAVSWAAASVAALIGLIWTGAYWLLSRRPPPWLLVYGAASLGWWLVALWL